MTTVAALPFVGGSQGGGARRSTAEHPTQSTYAVVLAGGRGSRLRQLTDHCSKPALPFGGEWRIIDFALANCVNSGVRRIGVLTQYKAQSLIRHVTRGWGFLDAAQGEFVDVIPAQQQVGEQWYSGTADAVFQNLEMLREAAPAYVLVLAGDHVYKMDYGCLVEQHVRRRADVTVACTEVPIAEACAFGVVRTVPDGRIVGFDEKPARPQPMPAQPDRALASMGVYVFSARFLYDALEHDAADRGSRHDFGADVIPRAIAGARAFAHDFAASSRCGHPQAPYWRDVGTLDAYWQSNLDLTAGRPALDLSDPAWPVRSLWQQRPPARFAGSGEPGARVADSLVSGGCVVGAGAAVRRSLLSSMVDVGAGSLIEESLVLPGAVIGRDVVLRRAIVDERCVLPDGLRVGVDAEEDRLRFSVTDKGVVLVTRAMVERCELPRQAAAAA